MKKISQLLLVAIVMLTVAGCNKNAAFNGTYVCDTDKFLEGLNAATGGQEMPPELVQSALELFKSYTVVVGENEVTVSLGDMNVKGALKQLSKTDGETKYQITFADETNGSTTATLIFTKDGTMILDSGGDANDPQSKMYFKKQP
jgi:hypothetical protein